MWTGLLFVTIFTKVNTTSYMKKIILFTVATGILIFGVDLLLSDLLVHRVNIGHSAITAGLFAMIVFGIMLLRKSIVEMKKEKDKLK